MMDQDTLIDAVKKHMETLETISTRGLLLAVVIFVASIQGAKTDESSVPQVTPPRSGAASATGNPPPPAETSDKGPTYKILDIDFTSKQAGVAVGIVYCVVNIYIAILLTRLSSLIREIDLKDMPKAVTALSVAPWIMNPFSYFGHVSYSYFVNYFGLMLSVAAWVVSAGALLALRLYNWTYDTVIYVLFLAFSATCIYAVRGVGWCYDVFIDTQKKLKEKAKAEQQTESKEQAGRTSFLKTMEGVIGELGESVLSIYFGTFAGLAILCMRWAVIAGTTWDRTIATALAGAEFVSIGILAGMRGFLKRPQPCGKAIAGLLVVHSASVAVFGACYACVDPHLGGILLLAGLFSVGFLLRFDPSDFSELAKDLFKPWIAKS